MKDNHHRDMESQRKAKCLPPCLCASVVNFFSCLQHIEKSFFLLALFFLFLHASAFAAPQQRLGGNSNSEVQDLRDSVSNLRYQVSNHEQEIREFDEKLKNLDTIIESVRDQLADATKSHKEQLKGSSQTIDSKLSALDATCTGLVSDLRQFKTHANDSAAALTQYKQKIVELEKVIAQQNQNIEHLQAAMRALMEAVGGKDVAAAKVAGETPEDGNSYRIKPGDSLEKIARSNQTTVQAIKELNGMTTDKIVVGKVLLLPEKKE